MLAPILAQLISLGVGDRTELRYLKQNDERWEASTSPDVQLSFDWRRANASLSYVPSFVLTPLERKPREKLIVHRLLLGTSYRFRRTTLSLNSNLSFGRQNLRATALQDSVQATPTATPTPPSSEPQPSGDATAQPGAEQPPGVTQPGNMPAPSTQGQTQLVDLTVRYLSSTTVLSVSHQLSRNLSFSTFGGYSIAGGVGKGSRAVYPLTDGWLVGGSVTDIHRTSARDTFNSSVTVLESWSSNGNDAGTLLADETWTHFIAKKTHSTAKVGVSLSRQELATQTVYISTPTGALGIDHQTLLARGVLHLNSEVYSAPVLDPVRATVDPRVGALGGIGWQRGGFSTTATARAAWSVAPAEAKVGATNSFDGSVVAGYSPVAGLVFDVGVRGAARTFETITTIPPSWAAFGAVTVGYSFLLKGQR